MSANIPSAADAVKDKPEEDVEIDDEVAKRKLPHTPLAVGQTVTLRVDFPPGYKLLSAKTQGASFWTRTAKVTVELAEGLKQQIFFLKIGNGDSSRAMLRSEFEGVTALYRVVPELVPRPIAWGAYKSVPDTYFYLADFVRMKDKEMPKPQAFCELLAKLHNDSIPLSPAGKFGFHVQTYTVRHSFINFRSPVFGIVFSALT